MGPRLLILCSVVDIADALRRVMAVAFHHTVSICLAAFARQVLAEVVLELVVEQWRWWAVSR